MHNWSRRLIMWVLVGSLLLLGHAMRSEASEALDKIRQTVDDVMDIIANKNLDAQQRRVQIRQAVLKRFGFDEMAQRSLGQHWRHPLEQKILQQWGSFLWSDTGQQWPRLCRRQRLSSDR